MFRVLCVIITLLAGVHCQQPYLRIDNIFYTSATCTGSYSRNFYQNGTCVQTGPGTSHMTTIRNSSDSFIKHCNFQDGTCNIPSALPCSIQERDMCVNGEVRSVLSAAGPYVQYSYYLDENPDTCQIVGMNGYSYPANGECVLTAGFMETFTVSGSTLTRRQWFKQYPYDCSGSPFRTQSFTSGVCVGKEKFIFASGPPSPPTPTPTTPTTNPNPNPQPNSGTGSSANLLPDGSICSRASQCQSDNCDSGVCDGSTSSNVNTVLIVAVVSGVVGLIIVVVIIVLIVKNCILVKNCASKNSGVVSQPQPQVSLSPPNVMVHPPPMLNQQYYYSNEGQVHQQYIPPAPQQQYQMAGHGPASGMYPVLVRPPSQQPVNVQVVVPSAVVSWKCAACTYDVEDKNAMVCPMCNTTRLVYHNFE